jgi:hypothetical protein
MPELQHEMIGPELIRVFLRRGPLEVATYVTSHHLIEDKRKQLHAALLRVEAEAEV